MKTAIPLLKDHHNHAFAYASLCDALNLADGGGKEEAVAAMQKLSRPINVVMGWDDARYRFEAHELARLPPVVICGFSLHRYLITPAAREVLKRDHEEVVANIDNQEWVERNLMKIIPFISSLSGFSEDRVRRFFRRIEGQGVWYAEDMIVSDPQVIRFFAASEYRERSALWTSLEAYRSFPDDVRKEIRGIKVFLDGAIGARSAAVSVPYATGGRGVLISSDEALFDLLSSVAEAGLPVAIHALGDRATDQATAVLNEIRRNGMEPRIRIEHCQFISRETAIALKELGATLSLQPNFSCDSVHFTDRLPSSFLRRNNPFRMLIDDVGFKPGEDLLFGSDGMPHGAEFALSQALFPPHGGQRLSLDEFVAGYCMPDLRHGRIDIAIDERNRRVEVHS